MRRIHKKDEVLGRVADILRRSGVEDADALIHALDGLMFQYSWVADEDLCLIPVANDTDILASVGHYGKINVIKAVRKDRSIGLLEAKGIVDRAE